MLFDPFQGYIVKTQVRHDPTETTHPSMNYTPPPRKGMSGAMRTARDACDMPMFSDNHCSTRRTTPELQKCRDSRLGSRIRGQDLVDGETSSCFTIQLGVSRAERDRYVRSSNPTRSSFQCVAMVPFFEHSDMRQCSNHPRLRAH